MGLFPRGRRRPLRPRLRHYRLRAGLTQELLALLRHPEECAELGSRARDLFARHTGATKKTLDALQPLLKTHGAAP